MALKILEDRRKYVDAVVITGGEPTIHKELPKFLRKLKEKGFKIKLDTNGLDSRMLEECLPYLDYVAVDLKTSLNKYRSLGAESTTELIRTIDILKTGKVEYEFRTTVVPGFVETSDIHSMTELVKGAKTWALQQFVPGDTLDRELGAVKPYPPETIDRYAETLRTFADQVLLRT